ncbi:hypothetical protein [Streptomyces sp. NPDC048295]|uniref:hypothetical protein n=1 Tax=Streptomyces sp. NPDC048295 TaxID=3154617 RepID=UPI003426F52F
MQHALTVRLSAPHAVVGVVIARSRMRGDDPILVGSGTLNFRKPISAAGVVALVLGVLVVLAVIVLAVYGGTGSLVLTTLRKAAAARHPRQPTRTMVRRQAAAATRGPLRLGR